MNGTFPIWWHCEVSRQLRVKPEAAAIWTCHLVGYQQLSPSAMQLA
jgi:hypothetical protein